MSWRIRLNQSCQRYKVKKNWKTQSIFKTELRSSCSKSWCINSCNVQTKSKQCKLEFWVIDVNRNCYKNKSIKSLVAGSVIKESLGRWSMEEEKCWGTWDIKQKISWARWTTTKQNH